MSHAIFRSHLPPVPFATLATHPCKMFPVYRPCSLSQSDRQLLTMTDNTSFCIWGPTDNPGEQQWIFERRGSDKVVLRNLKFNKYAGVDGTLEPSAPVAPTIQPIELTMELLDDDQYRLWVETTNGKLFLDSYSDIGATLPPRLAWVSENMASKPWKLNPI
ncbi:hypothetical protein CTheo_7238 [Ceratobasidium theobromae]|uniref:Ricin B lectin domain-containing protein n=1 Tax=Ceratobasidium theobromae TaxID=1582974 RepID=A0A5N5QCZ3_9AGAM|nr:hypothetical protein CTheo_7238 [Ceratobasidium theobromae]